MKEEIKSGEFIAVTADGSAGETLEGEAAAVGGQQQVQFIMAAEGEEGDHEGQTIGKNLKAKNSKYWNIILKSDLDKIDQDHFFWKKRSRSDHDLRLF